MDVVYVVIWDCLNPRPVAVFHSREHAQACADEWKTGLDALYKSIGLAGDERVYVSKSQLVNGKELVNGPSHL